MIANRERSLSSVKIDDNNNITSIPIIGNDVGYGFDISVNNLPTGFVAGDLTPEQAYELLIISTNSFSSAISDSFDINLNQDQFNALVLLKYNIGYLSNINGLMDYIESGNYDRIKMESMINGYYDSLIDSNPENERYRIGWYNRTKTMLDIFFDGDYGSMPIDAEKGKVYP